MANTLFTNSSWNIKNLLSKNLSYNISTILTKNSAFNIRNDIEKTISYNIKNIKTYQVSYKIIFIKTKNISFNILREYYKNISYNISNIYENNLSYKILKIITNSLEYKIITIDTKNIEYNIKNSIISNVAYNINMTRLYQNIAYKIRKVESNNISYNIDMNRLYKNVSYKIKRIDREHILYKIKNAYIINTAYGITTQISYSTSYNIKNALIANISSNINMRRRTATIMYNIFNRSIYNNGWNIYTNKDNFILRNIFDEDEILNYNTRNYLIEPEQTYNNIKINEYKQARHLTRNVHWDILKDVKYNLSYNINIKRNYITTSWNVLTNLVRNISANINMQRLYANTSYNIFKIITTNSAYNIFKIITTNSDWRIIAFRNYHTIWNVLNAYINNISWNDINIYNYNTLWNIRTITEDNISWNLDLSKMCLAAARFNVHVYKYRDFDTEIMLVPSQDNIFDIKVFIEMPFYKDFDILITTVREKDQAENYRRKSDGGSMFMLDDYNEELEMLEPYYIDGALNVMKKYTYTGVPRGKFEEMKAIMQEMGSVALSDSYIYVLKDTNKPLANYMPGVFYIRYKTTGVGNNLQEMLDKYDYETVLDYGINKQIYFPRDIDNNYGWVTIGYLYMPSKRSIYLGLDSDNAMMVEIDGNEVLSWYGSHGTSGNPSNHMTEVLLYPGWHKIVTRHQEGGGGDACYLYFKYDSSDSWHAFSYDNLNAHGIKLYTTMFNYNEITNRDFVENPPFISDIYTNYLIFDIRAMLLKKSDSYTFGKFISDILNSKIDIHSVVGHTYSASNIHEGNIDYLDNEYTDGINGGVSIDANNGEYYIDVEYDEEVMIDTIEVFENKHIVSSHSPYYSNNYANEISYILYDKNNNIIEKQTLEAYLDIENSENIKDINHSKLRFTVKKERHYGLTKLKFKKPLTVTKIRIQGYPVSSPWGYITKFKSYYINPDAFKFIDKSNTMFTANEILSMGGDIHKLFRQFSDIALPENFDRGLIGKDIINNSQYILFVMNYGRRNILFKYQNNDELVIYKIDQ